VTVVLLPNADSPLATLIVRCFLATLSAFLTVFVFGPVMIRRLSRLNAGQVVRGDGPQTHLRKAGTPTMGGVLIVAAVLVGVAVAGVRVAHVAVLLGGFVLFAAIGFWDDLLKLRRRHSRGLGSRRKFALQALAALFVVVLLREGGASSSLPDLLVPFARGTRFDPGWLGLPLAWFVVVGTSNAVNLTDGLDGLACMQVILVVAALGGLAWAQTNPALALALRLPAHPADGAAAVAAAAIVGGGLGFLWYNGHPAQVFMGDVGALALGAALGILAVESGTDFFLFIMGGILVLETLSVVAQVASFKTTGRRVLRMAPLHHHFELKGWPETKVFVRFTILTLLLVFLGLLGAVL
jgi:phospho-N-acetylmuramoyl-pentapeptide-transferase